MGATYEGKSFYTVSDLCDILPIGRNGVYKLVNKNDFPKIVVGRRIIVPAAKFWSFIEENLESPIILE
ncbi:helix-turn-helix domain-containing protein [Paenibacillus sp. FSL W7-1332]|uniref:helix-turn-helix domain-containing protein n=1 Tax=Paenibacillus sp. FSL W7-1332 TaxID=2921702 RepID=UPI0030CB368F